MIKVINNNLVQSQDESGQEVLVMGCGLGFKTKIGEAIEESKIEKIYKYDEKDYLEQLKSLLSKTPLEHVQVQMKLFIMQNFLLGKN